MKIGWGIDVGVASLGFAVIELDGEGRPKELVDGVAIVYPAPTGAAERTRYKSMRTQNARRSDRMSLLRRDLGSLFDLPAGFDVTSPDLEDGVKANGEPRNNNSRVRLRAHGLAAPLSGGDLARAILHIAKNRGQRLTRGLKENPKADDKAKKEAAKERQSMAEVAKATGAKLTKLGKKLGLAGNAHPAQYLMDPEGLNGVTRLKKDRENAPVFTRDMMTKELAALLNAQRNDHDALNDSVCKELLEKTFREEKPKAPEIGKCRYGIRNAEGEIERRLPRGSDLFQRKRIYEEVNNLRLISSRTAAETSLDIEQRDGLASLLLAGEDLTAARVRRELKLGKGALADKTSLDISDKRKGRKTAGKLSAHPLAAAMSKAGALDQWREFDSAVRELIAALVRTEDDVEALAKELATLDLAQDAIEALSDSRLPATFSAAGETATRRLLAELQADVISNHEAEKRAGLDPLDPEAADLERLPYYGEILSGSCIGASGEPDDPIEVRFGRIPNPVVHVGLNQIRKLANSYIDLYGKPDRICVELARDLNKSTEEREKDEKEAGANRARNERYIETLGAHTRKLTRKDLTRMKLHDMQGGECMYTGRTIDMEHLFDGSVEIDHILPWKETRDVGIANLALAFAEANQFKAKRPPFEAFSQGYAGKDYEHILRRAWKRGRSVYWRFKEDAMERYRDEEKFRSRFLNDTRYVARMATRYLAGVCTDPNGVIHLSGGITADLRREWGLGTVIRGLMIADGRLNAADVMPERDGETLEELKERRKRLDKIRWDHRHHLLDAIVIACTQRRDVQRLQTLAARKTEVVSAIEALAEARRADPDFRNAGICWQDGFGTRVTAFLEGRGRGDATSKPPVSVVVPKADHDPGGQLHKETNYGVICAVPRQPGQYVVRSHVALRDLTRKQIEEIGIPETVFTAVAEAVEQGAPTWWGGEDPLTTLRNNLGPELAKMRNRLLSLMDRTPASRLAEVKSESGREKARAAYAVEEYAEAPGGRRYMKIEVLSARVLKGPVRHDKKPKRTVATRGNDRLIYFVNGDGERDLEVVSTLDANTGRFRERWRLEGGRPLFALRKDDLVEMAADPGDPSSPRRIYRTVSFSFGARPDLEFLPVEESRAPKEVPHGTRTRITSVRGFRDRAPVMVLCDPTGRVRWRGPRTN